MIQAKRSVAAAAAAWLLTGASLANAQTAFKPSETSSALALGVGEPIGRLPVICKWG